MLWITSILMSLPLICTGHIAPEPHFFKAKIEEASNGVALKHHGCDQMLSCKDHDDCTVNRKTT